jgi:hypothetical protein
MPKAAKGTGRRSGASRRDDCAPRVPGIRVTAPRSGHSWGIHMDVEDGGGVAVYETQKLAEPSTATWGMSFVMQSTILEAVTTRLVSQKAPRDKQGHCGCAHKHKPLVERRICRSTQHISDWLLDAMDGNRSQNASYSNGLSSFGCILEMLEPSLRSGRHIAANAASSCRGLS